MADHLADFLRLPSEFTRFAFGAGPGEGYACYVTNIDQDWPTRSEVSVTVFPSREMFPWLRSSVYRLGRGPLPSEAQAREYFVTQEKILSGRIGLLGLKERVSSTGIEERTGKWSLDLNFSIGVSDDPIFGSFTRTDRLLYLQGDNPFMLGIRALNRNESPSCQDLLANEFDPACLRLEQAFENRHERRAEAVPELLRMEAEGIPVPEMTRDMVEHLAKNLRATLPELHLVGHIVSRSNILLWHALGEGSAIPTAELERWSAECARLALDLPDQWFRHFVGSSIITRSGLMFGEEARVVSPHEIEGLIRYASVLRHLSSTHEPTAQQGEVAALVTWILQALQNVADIGVCKQVCQAASEIEGDDVSLNRAVENAVEQAAQFAQRCGDSTEAALLGIRRSELAATILQAASARRRVDAGGNSIHSALFGKIHQYNFHYQGMLYGLDANGINAGLQRAARGMPPGVLYLRPLSTLRSVFVPITGETTKPYPVATLEAALTNCVSPLYQATNAVGGLGDILGMQRSDFVGEGDTGWQLLVSSLMNISGAIIVLPDDSEGVSWEIGQIAERDLFAKCIFVLLPLDLDWSDQGNRRGFARAFQIEKEALDRDGGFFVGHPNDNLLLPWAALWDGKLAKQLENRTKLEPGSPWQNR